MMLPRGPMLGAAALSVALLAGTYTNTGSASAYTWSGASFGDEAADRQIIVGVCFTNNASSGGDASDELSSVTVGGVAAEIIRQGSAGSSYDGRSCVYWGYADVPSGTTGDIIATFSGAQRHCYMVAWRATAYDGGFVVRGSDGDGSSGHTDNATATISSYEEPGTYAFGWAMKNSNSTSPTYTSTGWTKVHEDTSSDYDVFFEMYWRSDEADPISLTVASNTSGRHRVEMIVI